MSHVGADDSTASRPRKVSATHANNGASVPRHHNYQHRPSGVAASAHVRRPHGGHRMTSSASYSTGGGGGGGSAGGRNGGGAPINGHHGGRSRRRASKGRDSADELLDHGAEEVIQVEIVPQDDTWGDNTTCVTGNTSERSGSYDDLYKASTKDSEALKTSGFGWDSDYSTDTLLAKMQCIKCCSIGLAAGICVLAFISPIAMVILPKLPELFSANGPDVTKLFTMPSPSSNATQNGGQLPPASDPFHASSPYSWRTSDCTVDCEGLLIGLSIKLLILLIGILALFARRFTETLPRIYLTKWLILVLIFLITFAYWLFYGVRILQKRESDYGRVVTFAASMLDTLLFVHYLAVILFEIRYQKREFKIYILRSPDGESRVIGVGRYSIQNAAVHVLRRYYTQFTVYNPFLDRLPASTMARLRKSSQSSIGGSSTGPVSSFKIYDLDNGGPAGVNGGGGGAGPQASQAPTVDATQAIMAAAARKRDSAHNERFYEELEWERRVKKRRARLLTAAEEAFGHVKRMNEEKGPCVPMEALETAQNVFPSLARSLRKYLNVTRQQPRHTADQVIRHLARCLSFDVSPRAFLDRFFSNRETHDAAQLKTKWSIVSERPVSRDINHGTVFQLRCHCPGPDAGVSLLCVVTRLPFFDLTEEFYDPKFDKFVLRVNSETSV